MAINLKANNLSTFSENNDGLRFANIFFIAAAFTSSFDIFLVINFGFNFRVTQLLMLVPLGISCVKSFLYKSIWPLGFHWLICWTFVIIIFIPNTNYYTKSIGYAAWLIFDILMVYACVQIYSTVPRIFVLLRWYLYSFLFISLFGLLQFISPVLGLGDLLLIETWWIPGVLPRLNGFSYEPSFYATYLLMGWVLSAFLLESKSSLLPLSKLRWIFVFISTALLLCGSRMGILMMVLWYMKYPIKFMSKLLSGSINTYSVKIILLIFICSALIFYFLNNFIYFDDVAFLFSGIGLLGSGSHSVDTREGRMLETFSLFLNSPFIGYSLGGIAPAIAALHGITNLDFETVKEFEGNSIFVEVLAASGIIGIVPFIFYLFSIIFKPIELSGKLPSNQSKIIIGLSISLIFEFIILQFNQVILRPYLWMHIAVLSASYSVFSNCRNNLDPALLNNRPAFS